MFGPFSTRRAAVLYLLAWLILGVVLGALIVGASTTAWVNALLFAIPITLVYAFATGFSAYYLCRAYPLAERSPVAVFSAFSVTAVFAAALWTGAGLAWNSVTASAGVGLDLTAPLKALVFGLGVLLYGLSGVVNYLAIEFERTRVAERRELESKLLAQDAELRMLRTQIDPHFLFNSLNSISALTSINPAAARAMTLQLSDFFRHSLRLEAHRKVTLETELELTAHFLAIEKVRFGARLIVAQEVDAHAQACLLPPMILQPLVENAVKHGIGNLTEGGTIRITACRAASILRISVENDVDRDLPEARGNGIGLANVRQRLTAAYGHEASVHWARSGTVFRVELSLPAETVEAPACA